MSNLKIKKVSILLSCVVSITILATFSVSAQEPTLVYPVIKVGPPSGSKAKDKVEKIVVKYMCVGKHNGISHPCKIKSTLVGPATSLGADIFKLENLIGNIPDISACTSVDVEDVFVYGGHVGDKSDGTGEGSYTYGSTDYLLDTMPGDGDGRYFVEGETNTDFASELVYEAPERSGIYGAETFLTTPDAPAGAGFVWLFIDGFKVNFHLERHIIGLELGRLPGCPDGEPIQGQNYILSRDDKADHPEGHWGILKSHIVAIQLANLVFGVYDRHMSYNDLSLPLGGKHDLHPGGTHRAGGDIDINAVKGMTYFCNSNAQKDRFIKNAFIALYGITSVIKGKTSDSLVDKIYPNMHCYASGFMHIDTAGGP